jgi:N utilization substance protein B
MIIEKLDGHRIKRYEEREFTLQTLYACEFNDDPWQELLVRLEKNSQIKATPYVTKLISICQEHKEKFDQEIIRKLKNWDFKRIAIMDKVILRMAIAEIVFFEDIPPEVSINEAIELAKKFSTDQSSKFINGMLDAIYRQLQKEKKINKSGRGLLSKIGKC